METELKEALKESFSKIKKDIDFLKSDINKIKSENKELKEKIIHLEGKIQNVKIAPTLQTEINNKLNRNKKGIIKQKIIEQLEINQSIPEIKEIIVDQQKYCSKASFYRYIEELKRNGKINKMEILVQ